MTLEKQIDNDSLWDENIMIWDEIITQIKDILLIDLSRVGDDVKYDILIYLDSEHPEFDLFWKYQHHISSFFSFDEELWNSPYKMVIEWLIDDVLTKI